MENNRNVPNNPNDYTDNNDYSNIRNPPPLRSQPSTPKVNYMSPPSGSKVYYRTQGNHTQYYTEEQMRNMLARRAVTNSSYSPSQLSHRQMVNQLPQTNPQIQGTSTRTGDAPLKGILVGNKKNNILEGQRRIVTAQQGCRPRPKTPVNYQTASSLSNENSASYCGGEPMSDNDESQYYFINNGKNGQQNYEDNAKTIYDDQGDDVSVYKDFGYGSENELYYDPRDFAALDLRERPKQAFTQQMQSNSNHSKVEGTTYDNAEPNYYRAPQPIGVPRQSTPYGQMKFQNLPRNEILTQSPSNKQDVYKNVTEKLNEPYNDLKNVGTSNRKEVDRSERCSSINSPERYSIQEHQESNKKYIQNTQGDYQNARPEFKDGDLFTPTSRYKCQHEMLGGNFKRPTLMSHLDKYNKPGNLNGQHNPSLCYPLYKTQDLSNSMERKMAQLNTNKQKYEDDGYEESGSYVHMHKEYKKNQPVPGCCVDVYNNYKNDKSTDK